MMAYGWLCGIAVNCPMAAFPPPLKIRREGQGAVDEERVCETYTGGVDFRTAIYQW